MNKDNYVIKQANVNIDDISEKGILSGYANVYNIEDTDGDISQVGSFTKTVTENRKRIKILKNHDFNKFAGVPIELDTEDSHGLRLTAKMLLETPIGKQAYEESKFLVENGFESGFSIGGWVLKRSKANSQIVTEYKLNEISVLTCDPANQLSVVDTIKSIQKQSELTQEQFWKAITKAYDNHKFDDSIIKSLEQFLSLNEKDEPLEDTHKSIEPTSIINNIYKQFIL